MKVICLHPAKHKGSGAHGSFPKRVASTPFLFTVEICGENKLAMLVTSSHTKS
jgi:hypothetical protein